MNTNDMAIHLEHVGKMYKLYRRQRDKIADAFGVLRLMPGGKNAYREFWALRGLNLSIPRGQRLGIIGRNGSGKSTLLKIIAGNTAATEGAVRVRGAVQALMELGTGFHPEFTGRQNIHASLAYHGLSTSRIRQLEEEIVDFTELEDFIDQPVKTYSAGMYARLAFSTATSIEPEVLIIDEVLGAGDAYFSGKCVERMKRLTEGAGATVLFVSHDLGSVQQLCQRVIWIDRGRVVMDAAPLDVTKAYYASILQQEEIRLKARNARLSRRLAGQIADEERDSGMRELLLRFIRKPEGPPNHAHPVRRIRITDGAIFHAELEPGAPMDNDPSHGAHLLTDPQYMNWSEPVLHDGSRIRCIQNVGGAYLHAPFVFAIPQDVWLAGRFQLEIEHAARPGENIALEYFNADCYHPIGTLHAKSGQWRTDEFAFSLASSTNIQVLSQSSPAESTQPSGDSGAAVQDKWSTSHARFDEIQTIDAAGQHKQIFRLGEPFGLRIVAQIHQPLSPCWMAIVLYHSSGQAAALWTHPFDAPVRPGRRCWDVVVESPNLRQGDYVASVELLAHFDPMATEKLPFYCHWNRCVIFRIDEDYLGHIPLGLVRLDFTLTEQTAHEHA